MNAPLTSATQPLDSAQLQRMANAVRMLAADAVERAKSGHPGAPLGMAELATVLWSRHLRHDPADPRWPDRDRFVLSNGHAVEGKVLLAWGFSVAYGRPVRRMLRKRGWSRSTFYRYVDTGSGRIADHLNARSVTVS
jgi:hypothetical protein